MFDKHKGSKQGETEAPEPRPTQPAPAMSAAPAMGPAPAMSAAPAGGAEKAAMIGRGISISGDVKADSNLRVEGLIEGHSVQSSHDVEIAESARIVANITAKAVRIAGEVVGDISGGEKVTISRSGKVQGNIVAPRVQLEDGAMFRGSIDMNPATAAESRPAAGRPASVDAGGKAPTASQSAGQGSGQGMEAAGGSARKDPGLTLKSG
jgi:cytoskeletal protein CcmA (bactofilin family)